MHISLCGSANIPPCPLLHLLPSYYSPYPHTLGSASQSGRRQAGGGRAGRAGQAGGQAEENLPGIYPRKSHKGLPVGQPLWTVPFLHGPPGPFLTLPSLLKHSSSPPTPSPLYLFPTKFHGRTATLLPHPSTYPHAIVQFGLPCLSDTPSVSSACLCSPCPFSQFHHWFGQVQFVHTMATCILPPFYTLRFASLAAAGRLPACRLPTTLPLPHACIFRRTTSTYHRYRAFCRPAPARTTLCCRAYAGSCQPLVSSEPAGRPDCSCAWSPALRPPAWLYFSSLAAFLPCLQQPSTCFCWDPSFTTCNRRLCPHGRRKISCFTHLPHLT